MLTPNGRAMPLRPGLHGCPGRSCTGAQAVPARVPGPFQHGCPGRSCTGARAVPARVPCKCFGR
jgi:hypothetical protein